MLKAIGRFPEAQFGFRVVVVCQFRQEDQNFFAFVAVEPQNLSHFEKHYRLGGMVNFAPFGHELLRGPGDFPSDEILDYVAHKYNLEFDVDPYFLDRLLALTAFPASSPFPLKPATASRS